MEPPRVNEIWERKDGGKCCVYWVGISKEPFGIFYLEDGGVMNHTTLELWHENFRLYDEHRVQKEVESWLNMSSQEMRLRCGEISNDEIRTVKAVLKNILGADKRTIEIGGVKVDLAPTTPGKIDSEKITKAVKKVFDKSIKQTKVNNNKTNKMNSVILYSSLSPGEDRIPITTTFGTVYLRSQTISLDLTKALDAATPAEDETVLNTIVAPTSFDKDYNGF